MWNHWNRKWNHWNRINHLRQIHKLIPVHWSQVQSRWVQQDCRTCTDYCCTAHFRSLLVHWKYRTGCSVPAGCSGLNRTTWFAESLGMHKHTQVDFLITFHFLTTSGYLLSLNFRDFSVCKVWHHFMDLYPPWWEKGRKKIAQRLSFVETGSSPTQKNKFTSVTADNMWRK